jgi:hypothetical protein
MFLNQTEKRHHGLLKSLDEATPLHHCTEGAAQPANFALNTNLSIGDNWPIMSTVGRLGLGTHVSWM